MTTHKETTQVLLKHGSRRKSKRPRKLPHIYAASSEYETTGLCSKQEISSPSPSTSETATEASTASTIHITPKEAVLQALSLMPLLQEILPSNENTTNTTTTDCERQIALQCQQCFEYFKTQTALKKHCAVDHSIPLIYYCKICTVLFETRAALQKHKEVAHNGLKPYTCTMCPLHFISLEALTAHVRRHNGKLPYSCKICGEGFDLYREYKAHKAVHELRKAHPKVGAGVKQYACDECGRAFRKPCDLQRHVRVHTGEKPFACSVCGNRFQQAHNLTKHMIIHTKEKQFECDLCKKIFGRSDVLRRHMMTHSVQKPYECANCGTSFARKSQLQDHMQRYSDPQSAEGVCKRGEVNAAADDASNERNESVGEEMSCDGEEKTAKKIKKEGDDSPRMKTRSK